MVPPLLQTERIQLSQPLLMGEVFFPLITVMALFWVQHPRWGATRAEGQNHLPLPDGHTAFDGAHGAFGFLGCRCTLLAHVQHFLTLLSISFLPCQIWLKLVKALKKMALENLLVFHRKERVFTDKGIAESVKHHKTLVKLHFLTEENKKFLYIFVL